MNRVEVSVIIPVYNGASTIRRCLRSLQSQTFRGSSEIIVVDSSSDKTSAIVAQEFPRIRLVRIERQALPAAARNRGIEVAYGRWLAFIDVDCVASPDWLERLMHTLNHGHRVVGGSVGNANPGRITSWASHFSEFSEYLPGSRARSVRRIPTCNVGYDRRVFEELGGFTGAFFGGEDSLFHWELSKRIPIHFDPTVRVEHINRDRVRVLMDHQYRLGRGSALVRRLIDLPPRILVRHPWLVWLTPIPRTGAIMARLWRQRQPLGVWISWLLGLPVFVLGALAWNAGFYAGMRQVLTGREIHG